ncbi:hypothetical protein D3C87_1301570 [compost metagenome]
MIYSGDSYDAFGWAVFMGGGSLSNVPGFDQSLLSAAASMKPFALPGKPAGQYCLANAGKSYLFYNASSTPVKLDLSTATGTYTVKHLNTRSGALLKEEKIKAGSIIEFNKVSTGDEAIFINKI